MNEQDGVDGQQGTLVVSSGETSRVEEQGPAVGPADEVDAGPEGPLVDEHTPAETTSSEDDQEGLRNAARMFLNVDQQPLEEQLPAPVELPVQCQEAQNALSSAITSAENALHTGAVINRLTKVSNGKRVLGVWPVRAQDNLRAALLFAGAGLDKALKSLVEDALPRILDVDEEARGKFESWAQDAITNDDGVDPEQLVRILLSRGETPRDILTLRYVSALCRGSAQSSSRVDELASALGVTSADIRARIAPTKKGKPKKAIEKAFEARNEIAHELDVRPPKASAREPMERIRQPRRAEDVKAHVVELLEVGQLIINDVAGRAWSDEVCPGRTPLVGAGILCQPGPSSRCLRPPHLGMRAHLGNVPSGGEVH